MTTKIEWTDETFNPVTGCTKVSAGCQNCYAESMARRLAGRFGYPEAPHQFDVTLHPDKLDDPLHWRRPRRIFVCSMSDLFHPAVPFEYVDQVFGIMAEAPQHTYQVLTKRPERMLAFAQEWDYGDWRLPNVWLGVTAENQEAADERIPILLNTPAALRFVSCEPLLGPVDLEPFFSVYDEHGEPSDGRYNPDGSLMLSWVIAGGETGPGARPMNPHWVQGIRDQCQEADIPFFFKGWGRYNKHAGRRLDGREHNEMPTKGSG